MSVNRTHFDMSNDKLMTISYDKLLDGTQDMFVCTMIMYDCD